MKKFMSENDVQDLIEHDATVQEGIKNLLNLVGDVEFIPEDRFINGITADFTVVQNNTIKAIIECKAGNINLTDYVRGIGQLYQYEYFFEEKISHKSYDYDKSFKTVYFFPNTVIRNNKFNIAKFKYPESKVIYELNEVNHAVREITEKELKKLDVKEEDNLMAISQYYFRDNRVFEYYILMRYLLLKEQMIEIEVNDKNSNDMVNMGGCSIFLKEKKKKTKLDRKEIEEFLMKTNTINNGNWRNSWITLSNLGLINRENYLTKVGKNLAILDYDEFAVNIYYSYMQPYFYEIIKCFKNEKVINISLEDLKELIRKNNKNRDVLYLTESDNRYISSWLNIMRDDYGIIWFKPNVRGKKELILNYCPFELNNEALEKRINYFGIGDKYIKKYNDLIMHSFSEE